MKYRWTKQEIEEASPVSILRSLITERVSNLKPGTPLEQRLQNISALLLNYDNDINAILNEDGR